MRIQIRLGGQIGGHLVRWSKPYLRLFAMCFFWIIIFQFGLAQTNFRKKIEQADPAHNLPNVSLEDKTEIHRNFLDSAIQHQNQDDQLYAHLLLGFDFINSYQYEQAGQHFNEAEQIAMEMENPSSHGWVLYRKGILNLRLKNYEAALELYLRAGNRCQESGDSLCMGESLEQVSVMYAILDSTQQAIQYHDIAMPLLEKYGSEKHLASALNNFGIVLSTKKEYEKAIEYSHQAIQAYRALGDLKSESKAKNNLADVYRRQNRFMEAKRLYQECIDTNMVHNLTENLVSNYRGLYRLFQDHGYYQQANEYIDLYYLMRDSLAGNETKRRIAEMEAQLDSKHREFLLEKSRVALEIARRESERNIWIIVVLTISIVVGIGYTMNTRKIMKIDIDQKKESLKRISHLLAQKNAQLLAISKQWSSMEPSHRQSANPEMNDNIFEIRILTDSDWSEFKSAFEKTYPKYIQSLRHKHPSLSEAEERLCLLLKLSLKSKEISLILGISKEGVKKTRQRLRKKMGLNSDENLDQVIQAITE